MTADEGENSGLSPDEAFGLVADETRLEVLRTLSESNGPLSFSTLFDRSEYGSSSNFSYHLDKLEGHFISRTDEGYAIRQTGRRIVEAVISGAVTDDPVVERTPIDEPCPLCSAPMEVGYQQERVEMYCSECSGLFDQEDSGRQVPAEFGSLGHIYLPPAGIQERTPAEIQHAAEAWSNLELLGFSAGICPRCAGVIDHAVSVCENHDSSRGICEQCGRRYAALFEVECGACQYASSGIPLICLLAETELLSFVTDHGANPLLPETHDIAQGALADYDEEVRSVEPVEVALSFTIRDETLTLVVDESGSIVDATREGD